MHLGTGDPPPPPDPLNEARATAISPDADTDHVGFSELPEDFHATPVDTPDPLKAKESVMEKLESIVGTPELLSPDSAAINRSVPLGDTLPVARDVALPVPAPFSALNGVATEPEKAAIQTDANDPPLMLQVWPLPNVPP